jgi:phosphoadenosine phosphosulfate reductase
LNTSIKFLKSIRINTSVKQTNDALILVILLIQKSRQMIDKTAIKQWNEEFRNATPNEILSFFLHYFKEKIAFSTSLGLEDQALTEMVSAIDPNTKIFTLDTGRLFPESYDLIDRTSIKYKVNIEVFFPEASEVESMVSERGVNLFYNSIANRQLCCYVRKLKPLGRALEGLDAWITGLRRDQSVTRKHLDTIEWDENNEIIKINPLINWTEQEVNEYLDVNNIPVNPLHKKGFVSIGCLPCTRAIEPGEDIRAGRWWWENPETKECGLHKQ